jgi:methionyl-tRNA formyltransferase
VRIAFFGNREMGCACLEEVLALGMEIPLVVTYPPDPDEAPGFRRLAGVAAARGLDVATPPDASGRDLHGRLRALAPDLVLSVYYGHRIPRAVRSIPPLGALNLHGSLLPRWRGRAPIPWVILAGDAEAGVTLHDMVHGMDEGDVLGREGFPVGPRDTATDLYGRTATAGRSLLRRLLPEVAAGRAVRVPQDPAGATVTPPLMPEREVDRTATVERFDRVVRAFARPYPGARTPLGKGHAILRRGEPGTRPGGIPIPLADGTYTVTRLALEGGEDLDAVDFERRHTGARESLGRPPARG